MRKPLIALTLGDPAGIGPEILLKAAARADVRSACFPVVLGDARWLARQISSLPPGHSARKLVIAVVTDITSARHAPRSTLPVLDFGRVAGVRIGRPSAAAGTASGNYIEGAVRAARRGEVDAIVTAPINKVSFSEGKWGRRFVGHTEMLAALTGVKNARLMLVHGALRAVHVTSHIPLSRVPSEVTSRRVLETIEVTWTALRAMGIRLPRIAVCGLNPHAGDGGVLGTEERRVIAPAIAAARRKGIRAAGPISADIVWPEVLGGAYDAGVAMYHDQGQIAVKLLAFRTGGGRRTVGGVNVTLGLPIIRTSPAHGTAFDIAGRGVASEQSLCEAILLAARMSGRIR